MKVAVVGATGMVGNVMLRVLAERNLPITELIPVASAKSEGKEIVYKDIDIWQKARDQYPSDWLFDIFF